MAGFGMVSFRVNDQTLRAQAAEVRQRVENAQRSFNEMDSLIRRTLSYWTGEAGEGCRDIYQEQSQDAKQILQRLRVYPDELQRIAGNYEQAENSGVAYASTLRANIIH